MHNRKWTDRMRRILAGKVTGDKAVKLYRRCCKAARYTGFAYISIMKSELPAALDGGAQARRAVVEVGKLADEWQDYQNDRAVDRVWRC